MDSRWTQPTEQALVLHTRGESMLRGMIPEGSLDSDLHGQRWTHQVKMECSIAPLTYKEGYNQGMRLSELYPALRSDNRLGCSWRTI